MSENLSKKLEKKMRSAVDQADLMKIAAYHGNRKAWLSTIARKTGITPRKIKSIYYDEPHRLWAEELDAIHQAIHGHHKEAVRLLTAQGETTNDTINELRRLLADTLAALRVPDSDRN